MFGIGSIGLLEIFIFICTFLSLYALLYLFYLFSTRFLFFPRKSKTKQPFRLNLFLKMNFDLFLFSLFIFPFVLATYIVVEEPEKYTIIKEYKIQNLPEKQSSYIHINEHILLYIQNDDDLFNYVSYPDDLVQIIPSSFHEDERLVIKHTPFHQHILLRFFTKDIYKYELYTKTKDDTL